MLVAPTPITEGQQYLRELAAGHRVQVRRRLVEHEDLRPAGQHGRQRHPPPLATRQVQGRSVAVGEHVDGGQRGVDPLAQRSTGDAEVGGPERDVVADGRHEQLVVGVLEDDPHPAADLLQVRRGHRQPAHGDPSGAGPQDAVEVQHQRRLARPVRAEQRDPLAGPDPQVDPVQGPVPVGVGVGEPGDVQRRRRDCGRGAGGGGAGGEGNGHATLQPAAASATANPAGARPASHCRRLGAPSSAQGMAPSNPRESIARCTRSPRS